MDYAQFEKLLTNAKIIQTTLSDAPSNLYDGATSYESKRANAVDNYGLSKKLKAVYGTYLDLIKGQKKTYDTIAKLEAIDLSSTTDNALLDESLSQDKIAKEFIDGVEAQKAKEIIKLYFSQYLNKLNSDMQWRIGQPIDSITDVDDTFLVNGKYPSRGFVIPTRNNMIYNGKTFPKDDTNFVSYGFPPYKLELNKNIIEDTTITSDNPDSTFDLKEYSIDREEYTYREMGMKALTSYIDYLQYLTEGATGIVSTYMTEWDLSNYMQENLMSVTDNNIDLTLNYRIRQDNPFSDREEYRGDKALCFNVCGSSVSKLYHDNEKLWLPSDYVYSSWWTPYLEGVDFTLKQLNLSQFDASIQYMDCYDNFDISYNYDSQTNILDVIKHQDILHSIISCKTSFTARYYDAFYSSSEDALSDYDVMLEEYTNEAAGSSSCRDIASLIQDSKIEMLCAGGYENALYSAAFSQGGLFGKRSIIKALEKNGEYKKNELLNQSSQVNSADIKISADGIVDDLVNSNNMNGATLAKMDGISRFAPAIYGGNHGACYSLNSLRGHFDNTILNLNTPTLNLTPASNDFSGMEAKYRNNESFQICRSPTMNNRILFDGELHYVYRLAFKIVKTTQEIEADIFINAFGRYDYSFPATKNGRAVVYSGKQYTKRKTFKVADILAATNEKKEKLNYYSIFNNNSILTPDRYDPKQSYVTIEVPCKQATYYDSRFGLVKLPIINDNPDIEWTITMHKFDEYAADTLLNGSFLRTVKIADKTAFRSDKLSHEAMSQNPGFILRFPGHPEKEQEIIRNMMWYGKGLSNNNPIYLYFLEGNKEKRYTEGPESIIKAPCYIKYYDAKPKRKSIFRKIIDFLFNRNKVEKTNVPYIYVDLFNAVQFYDGLNRNTNYVPESGFKPLHTSSDAFFKKASTEAVNPVQKLHKINQDILISQKGSVSISNVGLDGIGILTGLIGLNSKTQDLISIGSDNVVLDSGLGVDYSKDTPLETLPLYTAHVEVPTSWYVELFGRKWMTDILGHQEYVKQPYDQGLRKAYINMLSRVTMFKYADNKYQPYFLDMSSPYRVILSALISHKNYLKTIQDLLGSLGAEYIHDTLVYNVDRCVLYACGMTFNKEGFYKIGTPFKTHIFYNYWIDKAVHNFGNINTAKTTVKNVINYTNQLNTYADKYISTMKKILEKQSRVWTINDIETMNKCLASIKETFYKRNTLDDFMMMYLNILYFYRLFYIGNRFNKVDGTMWRMRHLEASLHLVKQPNIIKPKSPSEFQIKPERHSVAFYELQNTTAMKTNSIVKGTVLDKDRIYRIYVKVNYTNKEAYDKWILYKNNPDGYERVPEVDRYLVNGEYKYVLKPADGIYQFRSKEYNDNEANVKWNARHINDIPRNVWKENIDCKFNITWHNSADKTPIRWNVLGNINVDNLLEYAPMGITGEDLVCLIEEGSDFWTINIPEGLWPEKSHYINNLYIKQVFENEKEDDPSKDAYVSILGPLAHSISPIIKEPMDVSLNFTNKL